MNLTHCVQSVRIRSYSGPNFSRIFRSNKQTDIVRKESVTGFKECQRTK